MNWAYKKTIIVCHGTLVIINRDFKYDKVIGFDSQVEQNSHVNVFCYEAFKQLGVRIYQSVKIEHRPIFRYHLLERGDYTYGVLTVWCTFYKNVYITI